MNAYERPYRDFEDLRQIGLLIRRAYARAPYWNAWGFARFDIWAQRRIGAESVHGRRDWQRDLALWEDADGDLVGAALFECPHEATLLLDPGRRELAEAMIDWAERHYAARGGADEPLTIEAMESNAFLEQRLQAHQYAVLPGHFVHREKALDDGRVESVQLPPGFRVKHMETLEELRKFHRAIEVVFNFRDSVEVYQIVQQAPSFVHELDLLVLAEDGQVAAFCTAWLDRENAAAEFEPVGTAPDYRQRGLAAAVLAEASNRLRARGCRRVIVNSWNESVGANRLYEAAGLQPRDRIHYWRRASAVER